VPVPLTCCWSVTLAPSFIRPAGGGIEFVVGKQIDFSFLRLHDCLLLSRGGFSRKLRIAEDERIGP
jgi:hypothetical protein